MTGDETDPQELLDELNAALGWEMRAEVLYGHYAVYVKGIHRLHLKPFFEGEAAESILHARTVREQIARLDGEATTNRDGTAIVHTTDYKLMLREAYETEARAAACYKKILALPGIDPGLYDALQQISFEEERSIEELSQLLD